MKVTQLLEEIRAGDPRASARLLPLVYEDLRALAARKMNGERGHSAFQATALVHEAYLRLVGENQKGQWNHRGHFFAAAAEAMRRILVEMARARACEKRGGNLNRQPLFESGIAGPCDSQRVLAVHDALQHFEQINPQCARLVQLRFFGGLTNAEAAEALSVSPRQATKLWAYARVWLAAELDNDE